MDALSAISLVISLAAIMLGVSTWLRLRRK